MNFPQACINLSIEGLTFRFVRFIDRIWYKLWQIHTMHRNYWLQQEDIVLVCREWIFIEKYRLYLLVIIVYLILKLGWSVNLRFMYRIVSSHAYIVVFAMLLSCYPCIPAQTVGAYSNPCDVCLFTNYSWVECAAISESLVILTNLVRKYSLVILTNLVRK